MKTVSSIKFTVVTEKHSDEHNRFVNDCNCNKNKTAKHSCKADHNFNWDQKKN